jgi:ParB-like chromosome segregation protein Spo0J
VKTSDLIPYVNNARTHDEEQIKKIQSSIREFGFINPVIIDDKNNIIAGHGRVQAALKEGIQEVPCVIESHLSEYQKKAYILADNKLAELSGWDFEILANELEELKNSEIDIDMLGFDEKELLKLAEEKHEAEEDDFDLEESLKTSGIAKKGDVWSWETQANVWR